MIPNVTAYRRDDAGPVSGSDLVVGVIKEDILGSETSSDTLVTPFIDVI